MNRLKFFLFDIDGTLLSSGAAGQAAMEEALLLEFGLESRDYEIPVAGRTDRAIITDLFAWHQLKMTEELFLRFRDRYLQVLPKHLTTGSGRILPGVTEVLEQLSALTSRQMGLLTGNFETSGWMKVRHYALDHHFHFGAFGDAHADRNDVARLAAQQLDRLGHQPRSPEQVWVIGDTPADVHCARAIGAQVLAVATGRYTSAELAETDPDALLPDLGNTAEVLEILLS